MRFITLFACIILCSCGAKDQLEYPAHTLDEIEQKEDLYLSKTSPLPFGTVSHPSIWNSSESTSPDGDITVFQTLDDSKIMFIVLPEEYNSLKKANQFVRKRMKQISIKTEKENDWLVGIDIQRKYFAKTGIKNGRTFYWFISYVNREDIRDEQLIAEQIERDFFWID